MRIHTRTVKITLSGTDPSAIERGLRDALRVLGSGGDGDFSSRRYAYRFDTGGTGVMSAALDAKCFRVFYEAGDGEEVQCFRCAADDEAHARELCLAAVPGAIIDSVEAARPLLDDACRPAFLGALAVGDQVWWEDPDRSLCSCEAEVRDVMAEDGEPITAQTVVVITPADGFPMEVFAGELH